MDNCQECPTCGHKVKTYKFSLGNGYVAPLIRAFKKGEGVAFKTADVVGGNQSAYTNFQKLAYWGLIETAYSVDTAKTKGLWSLTDQGRMFVLNSVAMPKTAVRMNKKTMGFEGEEVFFADLVDDWQVYADFRQQAMDSLEGQRSLFLKRE